MSHELIDRHSRDLSDDQMSIDLESSSSSTTDVYGFDRSLVRYGSITLLIVGTFGNIVSSIIFSYGTLRKSSTFRYLAILSLMDLLVLYSGLLDLFLMVEYGNEYSLRMLHPVTCRLHTFITYWSQHSSSWILSFISVDRAVATNCIRFARKFCTPRSAEYIVGTILLLIALINCHELIFLTIQTSKPDMSRTDDTSTGSSPGSTLSIRQSLLSNMISINIGNATRSRETRHVQSILSICDKTPWNVSCLRNRRDSAFPDRTSTTTTHGMQSKPIRSCRAIENSQYEYFWDNVSSIVVEREIENKGTSLDVVFLSFSLSCFPLGLAMDRCVPLCSDSIYGHEYWNIPHRLSCVLSTAARFSFTSCQSKSRTGHNTEQSQGSLLSSIHIESTLFRARQPGRARHHYSLSRSG